MYKISEAFDIQDGLKPYRDLVARLDGSLDDIRCRYPADIVCHKGCHCGCRNLTLFPVEALALFLALRALSAKKAAAIRQRADVRAIWRCPLLEAGACGLYPFRPIICRTHGFPLQTTYNGRTSIGCCRHNFNNRPAIPDDAIIDLDHINCLLRAVNAAAVTEMGLHLPERLSIAAAVLLERC